MSDTPEMSDEFRKQLEEILGNKGSAEIADENFYYALYAQAAEGNLSAQIRMATAYGDADDNVIIKGVDPLASAKWFNMAAAQGHEPSIIQLLAIAGDAEARLVESDANASVDIPLFEFREAAFAHAHAHGIDLSWVDEPTSGHHEGNELS